MEDKTALQQKLQGLERLRQQTVEQIPRLHGTPNSEMRKMLEGLNVEIAELRARIDSDRKAYGSSSLPKGGAARAETNKNLPTHLVPRLRPCHRPSF
jgi:hypothetical protein